MGTTGIKGAVSTPGGETSSPSPGAGNDPTWTPTLKIQCPDKLKAQERLFSSRQSLLSAVLPQRKGQAAPSPFSLDPVPGPSWLPGWLLALAFTPKGASRKQEMLPDAMPAVGPIASPQTEDHVQAAVLTGPSH